jgi:hypothetical protein
MANPEVAYFPRHPNRSKVAFAQLIGDWRGVLVRDGYRVYQYWEGLQKPLLLGGSLGETSWSSLP